MSMPASLLQTMLPFVMPTIHETAHALILPGVAGCDTGRARVRAPVPVAHCGGGPAGVALPPRDGRPACAEPWSGARGDAALSEMSHTLGCHLTIGGVCQPHGFRLHTLFGQTSELLLCGALVLPSAYLALQASLALRSVGGCGKPSWDGHSVCNCDVCVCWEHVRCEVGLVFAGSR